jgi:flagellar biosynthesis/type III secretory pathway protein FliH
LLEQESYSVESIVKALTELEHDIDLVNIKVEELKKRMINWSHDEIEKLKQQIISAAKEEAEQITNNAKKEAEEESVVITKESEENLSKIRKNIESLSDTIADKIVKLIIKGSVTPLSSGKRKPTDNIPNPTEQIQ